jgi:tRNA-uridine 2-sulfurtransferase
MRSVNKGKKVYVGMSGGVDSSVSAALLKKAGYDVTGVFIKVWQPEWFECTWREDRLDAMRVAAKLDIPFVTLDLEKEYKKEVVDYMIAEYRAGRTPNPDVMCNKYVKFGGFYKWAMAQGADYVATGHYARVGIRESSMVNGQLSKLSTKNYQLLTGFDQNKDQSYFLWTLTADQLAHTLFPVGDMEKPQVRKYAEKFGLATAFKKDSQGLCFIGKVDIKDFLKRYIEPKRGDVLSVDGEVVGFHNGATFFTLGERHGFTITKKGTSDDAQYVVAKDIDKNTVTVSTVSRIEKSENSVMKTCLNMVNIINTLDLKINHPYMARARYRQELVGCKITEYSGETMCLEFDTPQENISPGQSLVFYDGDVCLGGGIIA